VQNANHILGVLGVASEAVPSGDFWIRVALISGSVMGILWLFRTIHRFSKLLFWMILGSLFSIFSYNWVWEREEPSWATPMVERVAGWLGHGGESGRK
jgi:hypothetical protein